MSLTERETHFEYSVKLEKLLKTIDQKRMNSAIAGMRKLFPDGLAGKTFLDIRAADRACIRWPRFHSAPHR